MNRNLLYLLLGFLMGAAPQFFFASSIDADELQQLASGSGGAGLVAALMILLSKQP